MRELLVVSHCRVADERGDRVGGLVDIVVSDGVIVDITPAGRAHGGGHVATELKADGATVVPGLINMHDHLGLAHPGTREERAVAGESREQSLTRMASNASKALRVGVTTLRLLGEKDGLDIALKNSISDKNIVSPRLWIAAAPLDYVGGGRDSVGAVECASVDEYRQVAEQQVQRGADLLKLMMSGGGASGDLERVGLAFDEFDAVRSVARRSGIRMAVHTAAVPHPIMDSLIDDGVDSLEHCYLMGDKMIDRCIVNKILLVMTPLVSRSPEYLRAIELPQVMIETMNQTGEKHWKAIVAAVRRGAMLALGTDFHSHLNLHGTSAAVRELELYEEAGADPKTLLAISSRNGASWLGVEGRLGLVEEGFDADLLVLDENPLSSGAAAFRSIRHVISRGAMFEPSAAEGPIGR